MSNETLHYELVRPWLLMSLPAGATSDQNRLPVTRGANTASKVDAHLNAGSTYSARSAQLSGGVPGAEFIKPDVLSSGKYCAHTPRGVLGRLPSRSCPLLKGGRQTAFCLCHPLSSIPSLPLPMPPAQLWTNATGCAQEMHVCPLIHKHMHAYMSRQPIKNHV